MYCILSPIVLIYNNNNDNDSSVVKWLSASLSSDYTRCRNFLMSEKSQAIYFTTQYNTIYNNKPMTWRILSIINNNVFIFSFNWHFISRCLMFSVCFVMLLPCHSSCYSSCHSSCYSSCHSSCYSQCFSLPAHFFKHGGSFFGILHCNGFHLSLKHQEVLRFHQDSNTLQSWTIFINQYFLSSK